MINNTTLRAIALGAALGFVVAVVPSCGAKPATTKCNRNTCAGCCDEMGACFSGVSPEACGVDGITCLVCKTGQSCGAGACRNGSGGVNSRPTSPAPWPGIMRPSSGPWRNGWGHFAILRDSLAT